MCDCNHNLQSPFSSMYFGQLGPATLWSAAAAQAAAAGPYDGILGAVARYTTTTTLNKWDAARDYAADVRKRKGWDSIKRAT